MYGNSFFEFVFKKFNSMQLVFFFIGVLIGIIISLLIFLIIYKIGKRDLVKNEVNHLEKAELISYYQSRLNVNLKINDFIIYFKDEMIEMVQEIAKSFNEDSKNPLYEISLDSLIICVENIINETYNLLNGFSNKLKEANTDYNLSKQEIIEGEIIKLDNINNRLIEEINEKSKMKKSLKKSDINYSLLKDEINNKGKELKENEKLILEHKKSLKKLNIKDKLTVKERIIDKVINVAGNNILEKKLNTIFTNEIIEYKEKTIIDKMKSKIVDKGISVAASILNLKEIFKSLTVIIANNVYELYK